MGYGRADYRFARPMCLVLALVSYYQYTTIGEESQAWIKLYIEFSKFIKA